MANCAKCGKSIGFIESHDTLISFRKALKDGIFPEYVNKKVCYSCQHELLTSKGIKIQGLIKPNQSPSTKINDEINSAILWQKDEVPLGHMKCQEFFEDKTKLFGADFGHKGFLVVTNQRVLFVCKQGRWAKDYGIIYGANLEDIMAVSSGRFGGNDKLIILDKNSQQKQFIEPKINSLVLIVNSAISDRKNKLQARKEREHVQIILDFSSLKDVMSKGGLIMTTYKCPNCNGMVEIPEAGKVLMCQYCGTPIKPVDIFEKVKSLIQ